MTVSRYNTPEEHGYARFGDRVSAWGSIEDFLSALPVPAGVHVVSLPGDAHLDLLVRGDLAAIDPNAVVGVYFTGAVTGRADKHPPFFSGSRMTGALGLPALAISDPGLEGEDDLGLAWYTGRAGEHMQESITQLLAGFSDRLQRELLLIGGSGGGFSALSYAHRLGHRASALVWNPQTDLLDYIRPTVESYLQKMLGEPNDAASREARDAAGERLRAVGIDHSARTRPSSGGARRVLYLQNAGDWHLRAHARPYIAGFDLRPDGPGVFVSSDSDQRLFVSRVAEGHGPPSWDVLSGLVRELSRTESTTAEAIAHLIEAELLPAPTSDLPGDLREQAADLEAAAGVTAVRRKDVLDVEVTGVPEGIGAREIHVVASGPDTTLSRSTVTSRVKLRGAEAVRQVRATVYDGIGHTLFTLTTEDIQDPSEVRQTTPAREAGTTGRPVEDASPAGPAVPGSLAAEAPIVRLTRSVPGQLDVAVTAPRRSRASLTLYRGAEIVASRDWSLELTHTFEVPRDGRYRVRAFVLDEGGNRQAVTSDWCPVVS